jgi:hydroxymethylpyrimidine/phosphomethylpyrimidine kinase
MSRCARCLSIAGSDSSGGAGIQADLKTFSARGVFGMSAITAITAQNTMHVTAVHPVPVEIVKAQMNAVISDVGVDVYKVGMLCSAEIADAVYEVLSALDRCVLVLDPVMISKAGADLFDPKAGSSLRKLCSLATVVTPNLPEASVILHREIRTVADMEEAARELASVLGCVAVLLKGGHLSGDTDATDLLFDTSDPDSPVTVFSSPRVDTKDTHGTGCTLSACIASELSKGKSIKEAVVESKAYITQCIGHNLRLGQGCGPLNHLWEFRPQLAERDKL